MPLVLPLVRLRRRSGQVASALAVAVLVTGIAGCSGSSPTASTDSKAAVSGAPDTTPSGRPASGASSAAATDTQTQTQTQTQVSSQVIATPSEALEIPPSTPGLAEDYVAQPDGESIVLHATISTVHIYPSATSLEPITTLANPLPSGAPLTFLVDGQTSTRYKVLLPIKPNGSTGWIDPGEVGVKKSHRYKITVALAAHRITVTNDNKVIHEGKIAVGKGATPTPNGRYYIKELLRPPKPDGPYGPYAYGLSGFSPVVQNFKGGDDTIGIHGTDEPELLGTDVSHGCIRMSNAGITELSKILPLGTPVVVTA